MDTGDVWLKTASLRFPAQTPGESGNAGLSDGEQTGCGGPAAATRSSARCCKTGRGNRLGTVWPENFLHSRLLVSILFYYILFFAWYLFNQSIGVALSCCETGLKNENHHRRRSVNKPWTHVGSPQGCFSQIFKKINEWNCCCTSPETFTFLRTTFSRPSEELQSSDWMSVFIGLLGCVVSSWSLFIRPPQKHKQNGKHDFMEETKFQGCSVIRRTLSSIRMEDWFYILEVAVDSRWVSSCCVCAWR